jgi:diguanylate cyclase (GGDEF)-like protein
VLLRRLALVMGSGLLLMLLAAGGALLATRSSAAAIDPARASHAPITIDATPIVHDAAGNTIPALRPQALPTTDQAMRLRRCVAQVQPGDSPEKRLASLDGFDCENRVIDMAASSYWIRLVPNDLHRRLETLPSTLSVLSFLPSWQRNGAIYVHHTDGTTNWMALDNRTLSHETHVGGRVQLRLREQGARPDAILLRINGAVNNSGLIGYATLRSEVSSNRDELVETAIHGIFVGLCLALLMFNLALLGSMREGFQVTYCLMVISMLTYAWAHSGGWSLWFPERDITERFRLVYVSQGLTFALGLRFFVDILEDRAVPRWLRMLATGHRLWLLVMSAAMVVTPLDWAQRCNFWYGQAFAFLQMLWILIGAVALLRGSRPARALAPVWAMMLAGGFIRQAYWYHGTTPDTLASQTALLTLALMALLYALVIAMRVKTLAEERDHARSEERMARRLADMDPLTGLLNRRGLLAQVGGDGRHGTLRLLIVDVDHFKSINDTHGHDMGDEVLRELARVLSRRVAPRGRVARLGGEEFAVIGTAGELSPALALALLADVRQHRFQRGIAVTISIGMAEGEIRGAAQGDADWSALYRRADRALYEAKTTGRNRVVDAALMEAGLSDFGSPSPERAAQRAAG